MQHVQMRHLIESTYCWPTQDVRNFQIVKEQKLIKGNTLDIDCNKFFTFSNEVWWSQAGSNRRPPACKAGALPAELWPHGLLSIMHLKIYLVGLGRFELPTSPLSGVRSNQLSYRPKNTSECLVALRAKLGKFQGCCCYQITCEGTRIFVFWLLFAL